MSSFLAEELASQPQTWAVVADPATREQLTAPLPRAGQRVAAVGCGTSWFMAQAYASLREQLGQGETDAFTASELPLDREYDSVVLITRSGTTTEVVRVMEDLKAAGRRHVGIVATPGTPVAEQADATVLLPRADELSVVQTRFATTALATLRASLGEDLTGVIAQAQAVVDTPDEQLLEGLDDVEQVTFLGTGMSIGLAHEAALKLRESAQFWTESYPAMEYRHGPIAIAAPHRVVWVLGDIPEGLADEVRATGAHLEHRPGVDPMAELVRVHRLSVRQAALAGVDPDAPRNLTRSIILT